MKEATKTVLEMGKIHLAGNIIPHTWYQCLTKTVRRKATKDTAEEVETPYLEAIIILSDICYWYRPRTIRDENTGLVIRYERRFSGAQLQRSYQQLADMFGIGKDQARAAIQWLKEQGYIDTQLRTVITKDGRKIPNVMFMWPIVEKIAEISNPQASEVSDVHSISPVQTRSCAMDIDDNALCTSDTNTETSTENTSQTTTEELPPPTAQISELPTTENPLSISNTPGEPTNGRRDKIPRKDYLEAMLEFADRQPENRPKGWQDVSDSVFAVCEHFARLWLAGKIPKGTWGDRAEKWQAGASELLDYHDGDILATKKTLDSYYQHFTDNGGYSVGGPQSILNGVAQFLAQGPSGNGQGARAAIAPDSSVGIYMASRETK